jgi:hypothetical protein
MQRGSTSEGWQRIQRLTVQTVHWAPRQRAQLISEQTSQRLAPLLMHGVQVRTGARQ